MSTQRLNRCRCASCIAKQRMNDFSHRLISAREHSRSRQGVDARHDASRVIQSDESSGTASVPLNQSEPGVGPSGFIDSDPTSDPLDGEDLIPDSLQVAPAAGDNGDFRITRFSPGQLDDLFESDGLSAESDPRVLSSASSAQPKRIPRVGEAGVTSLLSTPRSSTSRSSRPQWKLEKPYPKFLRMKCPTKERKGWNEEEIYEALLALHIARCMAKGARWLVNNMFEQSGSSLKQRNKKRRDVWQETGPLKDYFGPQPTSQTMALVARRTRGIADVLQNNKLEFIRIPKANGRCSKKCRGGNIMFVYGDDERMFFCKKFFKAYSNEREPESYWQAGHIVHEAAHMINLVHQYPSVSNKEAAIRMGRLREVRARANPDSYKWFFRRVWELDSACREAPERGPRPPWRPPVISTG